MIDIESYAHKYPHYEDSTIPPLLERYLRARRPATLLDAGCGDGALVRAIVASGLVTGRVLACDASSTRLDRVKGSTGVEAFVDDVERLEHVTTGSIDFLVSSQVIEHVDDAKMLRAIERVTRPGAVVFLSTVQKRWYGWYFYRSPAGWALDPTHLREYRNDDELLSKVPHEAFAVLENEKTPIAWPLTDFLLKRFTKDRAVYAKSSVLRRLRALKVPIVGYSNWELVLERT